MAVLDTTDQSIRGLRFLESYDGYFFEDQETITDAESRAFMESLVSLLFGEAVVAPESYATDSIGFLRSFEMIRGARPSDADRRANPLFEPFILGSYWYDSPIEGLITRLRQTGEDGDPRGLLHLSGFLPISGKPAERRRLADLLQPALEEPGRLSRSFRNARKEFKDYQPVVDILILLEEFLATSDQLDDVRGDQGVQFSSGEYMTAAVGIDPDWIAKVDPDRALMAELLHDGLLEMKNEGIPYGTRSALITRGPQLVEQGLISQDVLEGLKAMSRTAWCTKLAQVHGCSSNVLAAGVHESDFAELGHDLGATAVAIAGQGNAETDRPSTQAIHYTIRVDDDVASLLEPSARSLNDVWTMLGEKPFWDSVGNLRDSLDGRSTRIQPKVAFAQHAQYLEEHLPELVKATVDGRVRVVRRLAGGAGAVAAVVLGEYLISGLHSALDTAQLITELYAGYRAGAPIGEKAVVGSSRGLTVTLPDKVDFDHE